ncbi:hypothetical protein J6590_018219 [Homalodisca vitripennis]|nr:hypothetical protein J6590_018219 [Homalodisca vitripennis]
MSRGGSQLPNNLDVYHNQTHQGKTYHRHLRQPGPRASPPGVLRSVWGHLHQDRRSKVVFSPRSDPFTSLIHLQLGKTVSHSSAQVVAAKTSKFLLFVMLTIHRYTVQHRASIVKGFGANKSVDETIRRDAVQLDTIAQVFTVERDWLYRLDWLYT